MTPVRLAVAGLGSIGRKHARLIADHPATRLVAIVDPADLASGAHALGASHYRDLDAAIAAGGIDGVLLATPTALHLSQALACIAAGLPLLIEKPVCASTADALQLANAAEAAGVPVLVGHHRRHNPLIAAACRAVQGGLLGRIVAVQGSVLLYKPDSYFDPDWRRKAGAGTLLTNLVHDIDTLRHLLGEIVSVQAITSSAARGYEIEDTAVVTLRFASGALGTLAISDTAAGPWSSELTAAENPDYPATGQDCTLISDTEGALELPSLRHWRFGAGERGWFAPLLTEVLASTPEDPLHRQISHFADVITGRASPLVSLRDAAASLAVIDAIKMAGQSGRRHDLNRRTAA